MRLAGFATITMALFSFSSHAADAVAEAMINKSVTIATQNKAPIELPFVGNGTMSEKDIKEAEKAYTNMNIDRQQYVDYIMQSFDSADLNRDGKIDNNEMRASAPPQQPDIVDDLQIGSFYKIPSNRNSNNQVPSQKVDTTNIDKEMESEIESRIKGGGSTSVGLPPINSKELLNPNQQYLKDQQ